jgi:ATP-dependent protease HslVU (ClpYQ) peptidase subunit
MTCIVGLVHDGEVFIGADSAGTDSRLSQTARADRKAFCNGDFVMGFTSSFRMGQLLAFNFNPPKPRLGADVMAYMVTDFIDAARATMKAGGYMTVKENVEIGGTFLVGYAGRLFNVADDFQVGEAACGYDAVGCGADIALGSLHATQHALPTGVRVKPWTRLRLALEAAERFSAGVRAPFHFEYGGKL